MRVPQSTGRRGPWQIPCLSGTGHLRRLAPGVAGLLLALPLAGPADATPGAPGGDYSAGGKTHQFNLALFRKLRLPNDGSAGNAALPGEIALLFRPLEPSAGAWAGMAGPFEVRTNLPPPANVDAVRVAPIAQDAATNAMDPVAIGAATSSVAAAEPFLLADAGTNAVHTADPTGLTNSDAALLQDAQLDFKLVGTVLEDAKAGRLNRRSPEVRKQVAWFLAEHPFTPEAYDVYKFMLENAPGNTPRRKLDGLDNWALEFEGGAYAPIVAYYQAYHLVRGMDYDAALAVAGRYLERFPAYHDRMWLLIALCSSQRNDRDQALNALGKIDDGFPDSPVVPEATFLHAWLLYQGHDVAGATAMLNKLVEAHPDSAGAAKARRLLQQLAARSK